MEQQNLLLPDKQEPIIELLFPLGVARWRKEGLFRRKRKGEYDMDESKKAAFVKYLYCKAFDNWKPDGNIRGGIILSPQQAMSERRDRMKVKFKAVSDPVMRKIMLMMIIQHKFYRAHTVARRAGYAWETFKIDFNKGLEEMMLKNKQ